MMKVYFNIKNALFITIALIVLTSCDNGVNFGEQYKKTLYIVNSNNIVYREEHSFSELDDFINISVYCAGTEATNQDVTIKLGMNIQAFDSINVVNALANPLYVNKVLLPEDNYTLSSPNIIIKANNEYGTLRIPFSFEGLNPDSSYVLPLSIESNNLNYDISKELNTILYEIKMINDFSGDYTGSSTELPKTIRSVQPTLKAMSINTVRMPIHTLPSDITNLKTNFMLLTIASDSVSVSITPWEEANITDLGGSTYDHKGMSFELNYSFINSKGVEVVVSEKITNLDKVQVEED